MSTSAAIQQLVPPSHNQLPGDDAVVAVNLNKLRDAKARVDSAGNDFRSVQAHAEGKGVNLIAAKKALKLVKSENVEDWLAETSAITRYLKILRHGVTDGQLNLDLESTLAPIEEKAALDGRSAGFDTSPTSSEADNPHALNPMSGQAWIAAFRQARAERDIVLAMKDDVGDETDEAAEDDED